MKRFSVLFLALLASCASFTREDTMALMATTWSTVVAPAVDDAMADHNISQANELAIRKAVKAVQDMLDSGDFDKALAIKEAWDVLKPWAMGSIDAKVEKGKLSLTEAALLKGAIRLFESRLASLMLPVDNS